MNLALEITRPSWSGRKGKELPDWKAGCPANLIKCRSAQCHGHILWSLDLHPHRKILVVKEPSVDVLCTGRMRCSSLPSSTMWWKRQLAISISRSMNHTPNMTASVKCDTLFKSKGSESLESMSPVMRKGSNPCFSCDGPSPLLMDLFISRIKDLINGCTVSWRVLNW